MKFLPSILEMTKPRPGKDVGKGRHLVPNEEYSEFWEAFYTTIRTHFHFQEPVAQAADKVNPYFGRFGCRFHPITKEPRYFHLGFDITDKVKTPVRPILDGILEYSGFGAINGNYVFLSHPEAKTEDGFVLHTLYMHLKNIAVKFSSYQKMLRQISFNRYPMIPVSKDKIIGTMGSTGISNGLHVHLHLQVEFRDDKGNIIVLDPARILGFPSVDNLTSSLESLEEYQSFLASHADEFRRYKLEKLAVL